MDTYTKCFLATLLAGSGLIAFSCGIYIIVQQFAKIHA